MLIFLTGGARSGKSSLAVRLAKNEQVSRPGSSVTFIATAEALDEEMHDRVSRHQAERPNAWRTTEAPIDLLAAVTTSDERTVLIIDCLSLWVSNLLFSLDEADLEPALEDRAMALAQMLGERSALTVVVTNEVGLGIVPDNALARRYRDLLGRANAIFAGAADQSFLCVAGRTLRLDPPPA